MAELQESLLQQIKEQGDLVRKLKSAKESNEKDKKTKYFPDMIKMDRHLSKFSYISGYMPSKCDIDMMHKIGQVDINQHIHLKRWFHHMRSFSDSEISSFPPTNSADAALTLSMMKCNNNEQQVGDLPV